MCSIICNIIGSVFRFVSFQILLSFVLSSRCCRVGFHSSCFLRSGDRCSIICSNRQFVCVVSFLSSFVISSRCCRVGFHSSRFLRSGDMLCSIYNINMQFVCVFSIFLLDHNEMTVPSLNHGRDDDRKEGSDSKNSNSGSHRRREAGCRRRR